LFNEAFDSTLYPFPKSGDLFLKECFTDTIWTEELISLKCSSTVKYHTIMLDDWGGAYFLKYSLHPSFGQDSIVKLVVAHACQVQSAINVLELGLVNVGSFEDIAEDSDSIFSE